MGNARNLLFECAVALAAPLIGRAFTTFAPWDLLLMQQRRMSLAAIALFVGVVGFWISMRRSYYRNWRPEVAVMPRTAINGDHIRITSVRDFNYRSSTNDFTVRYEDREVQLSHLTALDFYMSYSVKG